MDTTKEQWYYWVEPHDNLGTAQHVFMTENDIIRSWKYTHPDYVNESDDVIVSDFCVIHWATKCDGPVFSLTK